MGREGKKEDGDPALRACFEAPQYNELTEWISKLAEAKKQSKALCYGNFYSVVLTNGQCVFGRECDDEKVFVCINAADQPFFAGFDMGKGDATDLITGEQVTLNGGSQAATLQCILFEITFVWTIKEIIEEKMKEKSSYVLSQP